MCSELIDQLHDGEPLNWGAITAKIVGGGASDLKWRPSALAEVTELESEISNNPLYSRIEYKGTTKVDGQIRDVRSYVNVE